MIKQSKNLVHTLVDLSRKAPKTYSWLARKAGIDAEKHVQQFSNPVNGGFKFKQPSVWNDIARGPVTRNTPASERQTVTDRAINYANSEQFQDALQRGLPQVKALGLQPKAFTNTIEAQPQVILQQLADSGINSMARGMIPGQFERMMFSYYPPKGQNKLLFTPHFVEDVTTHPAYQKAMAGDPDSIRQFGKINWWNAADRTPENLPQHADLVDLRSQQQKLDMVKEMFQRNRIQRNYVRSNPQQEPIATTDAAFYETVLPAGHPVSLKDAYLLSDIPFKGSQPLSNILKQDAGNMLYKGGDNMFVPLQSTDSAWFTPNPSVAASYAFRNGQVALNAGTSGDVLGKIYAGSLRDISPKTFRTLYNFNKSLDASRNNKDFFDKTDGIIIKARNGYENVPQFGKFWPNANLYEAERAAQARLNYINKKYPDLLNNKGEELEEMKRSLRYGHYPEFYTPSMILRPILNGAKFNK